MDSHSQQPPPSLQSLFDTGCITDLKLFCCPETGRKAGPADRIDEWSDYRYASYPRMCEDLDAGESDTPFLMDKAVANHTSLVYACGSDGTVRWLSEPRLHMLFNEAPDIVPDEIRDHYTRRSAEVERVRSVLSFPPSVRSPRPGLFSFTFSLSNSGTDLIWCEVVASELMNRQGSGGIGGAIRGLPEGRTMSLGPGQITDVGQMELKVSDCLENGTITNRSVYADGGRSSGAGVSLRDLREYNSQHQVRASVVLRVSTGEIKDLTIALTPAPIHYLGDSDVFPPATAAHAHSQAAPGPSG